MRPRSDEIQSSRMHDIRSGICPLCDHREIIEARALQIYGETGDNVAPLVVTYGKKPASFLSSEAWNTNEPYGRLRSYICRACGYVQSFATSPKDIPIDAKNETRLIHGEAQKPYR